MTSPWFPVAFQNNNSPLWLPPSLYAQGVPLWLQGDLTTPQGFTQALVDAVAYLMRYGPGGVIYIPAGDFTMGVLPENEVGPNDGPGVILRTGVRGITFRGAGRGATIIRPIANTVEMFCMLGATDIAFEDMDIVGTTILQNQVKPNPIVPATGVAGLGNGANCFVRVGKPGNLAVSRCRIRTISHCIHYIGDWEDDTVLGGTIAVTDLEVDGFTFCVLALQYAHGTLSNIIAMNGVNSIDADGTSDPGHTFYGANRSGAVPLTLTISDMSAYNCYSSGVKIRKGKSVTVTNVAVDQCGRGFDIENLFTFTLSNAAVRLSAPTPDSFRSGLHLIGLANYEVSNLVIDRSGVDALGVEIEEGLGLGSAPHNRYGRLRGIKVIDDFVGNTTLAAVIVEGQYDLDIEEPTFVTTSNIANTAEVVDLRDCTRVSVIRAKRRSELGGNPAGSDLLVRVRAGCLDCHVEWARNDLQVAPTPSTINNGGTNTTIARVDGTQTIAWTPVVTFATPGDFVPTYTEQAAWLKIDGGEWATVGVRLTFSTNNYGGTVAGVLQITGAALLAADALGAPFENALARYANIAVTSESLGVRITNGVNYFTLRDNDLGGAGGILDTANFPPLTADISIGFEITFRFTET